MYKSTALIHTNLYICPCSVCDSDHRTPPLAPAVVIMFSRVLTQVTTTSRTVGAVLQPVHNVFQVSTVAAALTPHKQSLHHMVAHCAHAGTLVTPRGHTRVVHQRLVSSH